MTKMDNKKYAVIFSVKYGQAGPMVRLMSSKRLGYVSN